ncbi:hypothetical protein M3P05_01930 [Sansalvadorimonas sp. 2012CJ34-2]|uniref:Uncharacterized protein n=1 Tax=Parendozoicomonas callyspongiae TaxID=2942213 RepID=A0ABT0PBE8_9GAMM|nr:hypothetical protein [Sansalvadorimonas sp. 2012CJ34-2]MCL6268713.1 hypothetical protein [Sansalvadorimonas sp. 2012CJ34-2]
MSVQGPNSSVPQIYAAAKQSPLKGTYTAIKEFFGRKVSAFKGTTYQVSTSQPDRSSTPLLKRKVAVRNKQLRPFHKPAPDPLKKQQLRNDVLGLNTQNITAVEQWATKLKAGLGDVADQLKKEGIKDVTMDLKLDRLLRDFQFDMSDYDILVKLQSIHSTIQQHQGGGNVVAHLMGKISQNMVTDLGFHPDRQADRLAVRKGGFRKEAVAARQQHLSESRLSAQGKARIQKELDSIIGRPYGLRADLQTLKNKLQEISPEVTSRKESRAIAAMAKDIEELLDDSVARCDVLEVNRLVLKMEKRVQTLPPLHQISELANWPNQYAAIMNPGK